MIKEIEPITPASVYVAKSFLILNNWTINRFCQEYNISIEKVQLINDGN